MRIGILRCDKVRSSLSNEFGEYPEMIEKAFSAIDDALEFQTYYTDEGKLPDCTDECDAYVITGSRYSVFDSDELWINQLRDFIVRLHKSETKAIGICFGHQLIAQAMGGKVERADCGWQIGVHSGNILAQKDYMQPQASAVHIAMMCEDQIHTIPDNAEVIATSPACEHLILQYNNHFLSTQGHPEFSQDFAKALIHVRQDEFPSKRLEKGLSSFAENELDGSVLFQWFVNFLTQDKLDEAAESETITDAQSVN